MKLTIIGVDQSTPTPLIRVRMTELLENTNTHGIENYVGWFRDRAAEI